MPGDRPVASRRVNPTLRRFLFGGLVGASTFIATVVLAHILGSNGLSWADGVVLSLFVLLFAWICAAFWTVMLGFGVVLAARLSARSRDAVPSCDAARDLARTALLVPIYNENVDEVYARVEAIHRSLLDTGRAGAFDLFILSDTTDPRTWIEEEIAWQALCRRLGAGGRVFYRHRPDNVGYKSGNIADFCRRWGRRYRYMIVLDADSLMGGATLVELVRRMERNPSVGLLQTAPVPAQGHTLFARVQQFAANLCGPAHVAGAAFWQLGVSNYWGHNAIIRVAAFMRHCGLPRLPGRRPFGGQILSHDFVEAALMARAGWEIRLAPDLGESYEEVPATLPAYARRDFRWCQGNLQHIRLIFARGLRPLSRLHLVMGAMTYLSAPLWLLFVVASALDLWQHVHAKHVFFTAASPFPLWPISHENEAITLLLVTLAILYLPKLLGLVFLVADRDRRPAFGGALAACAGVIVESLLSALIAPVLMAFHTRFVVLTLLGRDTGWSPQRRRAQGNHGFYEAVRAHAEQTVCGLAAGTGTYFLLPQLFWWMLPIVAGPVLALPLSLMLSSRRLGRIARQGGIFLVPSEARPSPLLETFRSLVKERRRAARSRPAVNGGAMGRVVHDPVVNALHVAMLGAGEARKNPPRLAEGLMRRAQARGLPALSADEQRALLSDAESMMRLHVLSGAVRQVATAGTA